MADLYEILVPVRNEAERRIKQRLSGLMGLVATQIYNSYMPINVNIQANGQNCTLGFKTGGNVHLQRGTNPKPDVSIQSDLKTLKTLLTSRNKYFFDQAERSRQIIITPHTQKGRTALNQIRNMFG